MILNDNYFAKISELYVLELTVIEALAVTLRHLDTPRLRTTIMDIQTKHLALRDEIAAFLTKRQILPSEPTELSFIVIRSEVIFALLFDEHMIFSIIGEHESRLHAAYDHLKNCREASLIIRKIIIDGWINTRENLEIIQTIIPKKLLVNF